MAITEAAAAAEPGAQPVLRWMLSRREKPAPWAGNHRLPVNILVAGRKSPVSLYNPHIATMEADPTKAYNQDDATGFIRLNALRLKVAAKVHKRK